MASVVTAPPLEGTNESANSQVGSTSTPQQHTVAAHRLLRMGRKATVGAGLNWLTVTTVTLFHIGAIAAFFFFTWQRLAVMTVLYVLAINVGIGMCYHRLLTHRGYKTPKWVEYAMTVCATLSLEGGPIFWVSTHRVHHQLSDQEGDPHTPHEGGWWAHTGWIFFGEALHAQTEILARYSPDLSRDKFHVWLSKYHWLPITVSGLLLLAGGWYFGGWESGVGMVLWGVLLRVTLGLHATWLVNSATHMWGSRRFETRDDSRNSWWVALLTGGEGWHNNHHAHPVSARHGLKWYEIDPNFWGIWLLSKVGLAKKIQVAKYDPADPKPAGL
ncbi:MAG: fatty acid desaturase [Acidobacteriota bacterium]|nr:fatty acid desaturase [Acidobacteriota bacterium]